MKTDPRFALIVASLFSLLWMASGPTPLVLGQVLPGSKPKPTRPAARPPQQEKVKYPEPETLTLETKDKVELVCSYFAPPVYEDKPEFGKSAMPFILLHDWKGSREQTFLFARFLQSQGHAAIAPDLRGHGASTSVVGLDKPIDYEKFNRTQMNQMVIDIEACKKFLIERNDQSELNIDLLTVVAIGEMAPVAAEWTYRDWYQFPTYNSNGIKQARDVKALVLVAPRKKFADYNLTKSIRSRLFAGPDRPLPIMVVWATENAAGKDAESICNLLEKILPEVPPLESKEAKLAATTLFKADLEGSSLDGGELLGRPRVKGLWEYIANTINQRVKAAQDDIEWTNRHPGDVE